MFRAKFLKEIGNVLDDSMFSAADFQIKSGVDPLLLVTFIPEPQFELRVEDRTGPIGNPQYRVSNAPGLQWAAEERLINDVDKIFEYIHAWVGYVYEDLRCASPVYDELEMLRAKLEEHVQGNVDEPGSMFSQEEIRQIVEKLGALEARILQLEEDATISEAQSAQALADIQKIITGAHDLPKGVWYKTAGTKIWKIITGVSSSKEGRMVLTQLAQKALGVDANTP